MTWPFGTLKRHHYRVILADPPWRFSSGPSRNPINHYPTMRLADIAALPVQQLANPEGARLFLWATMPLLDRIIEIAKGWGFRWCTSQVWVKTWPRESGAGPWTMQSFAVGTGYEVRGNPELLFHVKRGKVTCGKDKPFALKVANRREHSRKPDLFRDEIARLYDGPRCELFARSGHPAFDAWGNEATKFDLPLLRAA